MPEKLLFAVLVCFFISSRALFTITGRHLSCRAAPGKRIDYSTKFFSYNRFEEEGKGISPKVLLTAAVLSFGVFGTGVSVCSLLFDFCINLLSVYFVRNKALLAPFNRPQFKSQRLQSHHRLRKSSKMILGKRIGGLLPE